MSSLEGEQGVEEGAGSPGHPVGLAAVPEASAAGQSSPQAEDPS